MSHRQLGGQFKRDGICLVGQSLGTDTLVALRAELARLLPLRAAAMKRNGIVEGVAGTGHHLVERDSPVVEWLQELSQSPVMQELTGALDGPCVLNSLGAVDNRKGDSAYVGKVHRDVRTYTRDTCLMAQLLVPLDPFTQDNGATWMWAGSQLFAEKPDDDTFFANAFQVVADAGQIIMFDSRIWHAAGTNRSGEPRRALTLTFSRPFFKPQFDYCRYLGDDYVATLAPALQQLLGYYARVPSTMDEWYRPPERRHYRPGQG